MGQHEQIVIEVRAGRLTLGHTPGLNMAEVNLLLDIAKQQVLTQGKADSIIRPPTPEETGAILLAGGNGTGG